MNRTLTSLSTTLLIAALGGLAPTTSQAAGRPAPSDLERFYCHRLVLPVAMNRPPTQRTSRAPCVPRPIATATSGQTNLMLGDAARVHVGEVRNVEARGVRRDQPQVPEGPLPGESRRVLPAMPQMRP
jgi:hypothetical protein